MPQPLESKFARLWLSSTFARKVRSRSKHSSCTVPVGCSCCCSSRGPIVEADLQVVGPAVLFLKVFFYVLRLWDTSNRPLGPGAWCSSWKCFPISLESGKWSWQCSNFSCACLSWLGWNFLIAWVAWNSLWTARRCSCCSLSRTIQPCRESFQLQRPWLLPSPLVPLTLCPRCYQMVSLHLTSACRRQEFESLMLQGARLNSGSFHPMKAVPRSVCSRNYSFTWLSPLKGFSRWSLQHQPHGPNFESDSVSETRMLKQSNLEPYEFC